MSKILLLRVLRHGDEQKGAAPLFLADGAMVRCIPDKCLYRNLAAGTRAHPLLTCNMQPSLQITGLGRCKHKDH